MPLTVALLLASLVAVTQPAQGATTCRGEEATAVGEPGASLRGTAGDDVIVTNGASIVRAGSGADVVCVTGGGHVNLFAGTGDDIVDAGAFHGRALIAYPGRGSDVYTGSPENETVTHHDSDPRDRDQLRTLGGRDELRIADEYRGSVRASLGAGADRFSMESHRGLVEVQGGVGHDGIRVRCSCRLVSLELADYEDGVGTIRIDDLRAVNPGFENARVLGARLADLLGDDSRNRLSSNACTIWADGQAGADVVRHVFGNPGVRCDSRHALLSGGQGDDRLVGSPGRDRLSGGPGDHDVADGRAGRDKCTTVERRIRCEVA